VIFPEELDNRSFRLLVERIAKLQKSNRALSSIEQELADLTTQFPELGLHARGDHLDIYRTFEGSDLNPFLQLSAIWQVSKQIRTNTPKGIAKIINDYFHTTQLTSDELYRVATIYLSLYEKVRRDDAEFSAKDYLWEVYYALHEEEGMNKVHDKKIKSAEEAIQPGIMNQAFTAIARELHDNASHIELAPNATAKEIYPQLPIEWINAMSNYWQCSEQRLKRDKIKEIVNFFSSAEFYANFLQMLSREEKKCLSNILENGNCIPYASAAREFGPEHNDGYWWTQDAPKSTLGNLRMKGLLAVGEMTVNDETTRVVMIPANISKTIAKALSAHSQGK
jgi:DNA-binding transcriptional regulator YdaS (Cro superfamily)